MKKIIIASDHAGFPLKKQLSLFLQNLGYSVDELGAEAHDNPVDYPNVALLTARQFLNQKEYLAGVLVCGTGIGMTIAANKVPLIRCALPQNIYAARMAKEHNNANFIAFGSRIAYREKAEMMLQTYLEATFDPDSRHANRVRQIDQITTKSD